MVTTNEVDTWKKEGEFWIGEHNGRNFKVSGNLANSSEDALGFAIFITNEWPHEMLDRHPLADPFFCNDRWLNISSLKPSEGGRFIIIEPTN